MKIVLCGLDWACVERGGKVFDGKTIDGIFLDLYLAHTIYRTLSRILDRLFFAQARNLLV